MPNLAEAVVGAPIRGSWWAHPESQSIYSTAEAVCASSEILVCKLINEKITYVHQRLWPALVKLAPRFRKAQLAKVWNEHTNTGAHVSKQVAFPKWVPTEILKAAQALSVEEAERSLPAALATLMKPAKSARAKSIRN